MMSKGNEVLNGKPIGIWSAVAIGIGGMIGAGIFSILGIATTIAGNVVYISFIIGGAIALLSTYSYAKLATKYPSAGGPVEFLVRGFVVMVSGVADSIFFYGLDISLH